VYDLDDEQQRDVLRQIRDQPRTISEIKIPNAEMVMGAVNPFQLEWVKRWLTTEMAEGRLELMEETWTNATGSKSKQVRAGKFRLTQKGIDDLKERNKKALGIT
jgi:hypothetical protein